jgi:hypothetical protein
MTISSASARSIDVQCAAPNAWNRNTSWNWRTSAHEQVESDAIMRTSLRDHSMQNISHAVMAQRNEPAAQENADSRVYAGIHFRSACQDGIKLGQQIGRRAFAQYLLAYRE